MKFTRDACLKLTPNAKRSFAFLFVTGAALSGALHFYYDAQAVHAEAEYLSTAANERFMRLEQIREARHLYANRFTQLQDKGIVDGDPRLSWLEAVVNAANRLGLAAVTYELEPTAPLTVDHPSIRAPVAGSTMTLRLRLLHEGELVRFLEQLRTNAPGIVWVRRCLVENAAKEPARDFLPATENLEASCRITWLTVRTRTTFAPKETE